MPPTFSLPFGGGAEEFVCVPPAGAVELACPPDGCGAVDVGLADAGAGAGLGIASGCGAGAGAIGAGAAGFIANGELGLTGLVGLVAAATAAWAGDGATTAGGFATQELDVVTQGCDTGCPYGSGHREVCV